MIAIIPTVLAQDKRSFDRLFKRTLPLAKEIQIDLMDGRFVPTTSIPLENVPDVRHLKQRFEAHLMVDDPLAWIPSLLLKGFKRLIIHIETIQDADVPLIDKLLKREGAQFVLALNPHTPISRVLPHVGCVDGILFLGVEPGHNGAPYVEETPARIREFVEKTPSKVPIQVDGGMAPQTVRAVVEAGATRINSGSFVANAADPIAAIEELRMAARGEA